MSAGRKAFVLGLGLALATVAGITISVLNGVDVSDAITAAALATIGVKRGHGGGERHHRAAARMG